MSRLSPVLVALALGSASTTYAQDSDSDGVTDGADVFPCDAALAGEGFAPAEGTYGTLLFEDEWPEAGDQDLNDLVLDYNYHLTFDGQGRAVSLTARYHVAALGGISSLGLGLHLPFDPANAVATVTDLNGTRNLSSQPQESEATYVLSPDLGGLFSGQALPFNVVAGQPTVSGQTIVVQVDFTSPVVVSMGAAPFDVYIFRVIDQGRREAHLPAYPGTSRLDSALVGTAADGSGNGRFFVDQQGLPFVLDVPQSSDYPLEYAHVANLWPSITGFASSGGATNQDFYTTPQDASRFTARATAPALPTTPSPDTSCVPSGSYPDPAGFNVLWHVATHGDDAIGDGSAGNPFASVHTAIAAAASGDGVQIHPGIYRLVPQVHYSGFMVAGIYDQSKRLTIFGANDLTILEMHGADNTSHRDAHAISLKGQQTINGVVYGSVVSNLVMHFYPNRSTNYSNAIVGWNKSGAEIHNVVFENRSTTTSWAYIYDNTNPADTPRIFNSVFISNGRWVSRYTGRPSFINCLMENAPLAYTNLNNNVYRAATAEDTGSGPVASDLLNAGDPAILNPDGTRSHIGIQGGLYAWP